MGTGIPDSRLNFEGQLLSMLQSNFTKLDLQLNSIATRVETNATTLANVNAKISIMETNITHVKNEVSKELDDFKEELRCVDESISKLEVVVKGDGTEKNPGLSTRMDRIERWMEARVWAERVAIGAVIAETVALLLIVLRLALTHTP